MKKINKKKFGFLFIFVLLFISPGCNTNNKKPEKNENKTIAKEMETKESVIKITLKNTKSYKYNTGIGGDEEDANVLKQAKHYMTSEIVRTGDAFEAVYTYKPAKDYIGNDYVELRTAQGSDGASPHTKEHIIKIHFTITK